MAAVHTPPISGSWYPSGVEELRELVDAAFAQSEERTGPWLYPRPLAFVVPHAALCYSGVVAAAAYRHLRRSSPRRVVLLGFSHRGGPGGISLPRIDAYRTPFGDVPLDVEAREELVKRGAAFLREEWELCDHSVEIQLPLLSRVAPEAKLTPVCVDRPSRQQAEAFACTVAEYLAGDDAVVLASTDFTHYGRAFGYEPFPVTGDTGRRLEEMDRRLMEAAGSLSPDFFRSELHGLRSTLCGREPVALLLEILNHCRQEEIFQTALDYQTSGEITGDFRHSVSYAALGYFPASSFTVETENKEALLESARRTLNALLERGERVLEPAGGGSPGLDRRAGVFVTLFRNGELRGCIGTLGGEEPLRRAVPRMTLAAALEDPRFPPVQPGEYGLRLEINVLSPFKRVLDANKVIAGQHGVMLESGAHRGLLLPSVARERRWNSGELLAALAMKAHTTTDVYDQPETRLYVFRSDEFGEQ